MVAASGDTAALSWKIAIPVLAASLAGLIAFTILAATSSLIEEAQLSKPTEVLADKARELIQSLGYTAPPGDSASGFYFNQNFLHAVEKDDKPLPQWYEIARSRPAVLTFWYRQSPEPMLPRGLTDGILIPGTIDEDDPQQTMSGMIDVRLDPQGRLVYFEEMPPEKEDPNGQIVPPPNWATLFAAAGLDVSKFKPAAPIWISLAASDLRQAWTGEWPGYKHRPLRVEAAAWHGRPVFFSLYGPWTRAARMPSSESGGASQVANEILVAIILLVPTVAAAFLARFNFVRGKGDRRGAMLLAIVVFSLHMALWAFQAHFSSAGNFIYLLVLAISTALFWGGAVWMLYLALEPYVRRYWPQAIISWTRVLAGRWRDPLVGRDVLYGAVLGTLFCDLYGIRYHLEGRFGAAPSLLGVEYLGNARMAIATWLQHVPGSISTTLLLFLLLFLFRVVLRKSWLAAVAFVLLFTTLKSLGSDYPALEWPLEAILYTAFAFGALRFGLVTLAAALFTADVGLNIPVTLNTSAWYFSDSILALASLAALSIWGFYIALAGQAPWKVES